MKKLIIGLALASAAATPATAGTLLIDTGIGTGTPTRPVDGNSVLLGQFTLTQNSVIDAIVAYGRVVTAGTAFFGIFANNANNTPSVTPISQFTATGLFPVMPHFGYYGVGGLPLGGIYPTAANTALGWTVAAGTYWVGISRDVSTSTFRSTVLGGAPNGFTSEGAFIRPFTAPLYVPTDGSTKLQDVNLSWRITGSVPEPATWAMMMLGFGLIGGAIRSTRRKPQVTKVTFAA